MATRNPTFSLFSDPTMPAMANLDDYLLQRFREFFGPDADFLLSTLDLPSLLSPELERVTEVEPVLSLPSTAPTIPTSIPTQPTTTLSRRERKAIKQFIPLDIVETDNAILVEASLPGVPKDYIDVTIDPNHVLTINVRAVPQMIHACGFQAQAGGVSVGENRPGGSIQSTPSAGQYGGLAPEQPVTIRPEHQLAERREESTHPTPAPTPTGSPKKQEVGAGREATTGEGSTKEMKEKSESKFRVLLFERQKGHLHRSVRLPKVANPEKVKTCMEEGILCLVFDKLSPTNVARRIQI